ncbi:MAG: hypothetical protein KA401_00180 [Anaerolineae bacterium]|nr:hypothetical protein [Anaerolineae bacterium]
MNTTSQKPGRPLGLTLAIVLSMFLYGFLPLIQLGLQLFIQDRISRIDSPVEFEGQTLQSLGSGGSYNLVSGPEILVNGGAALLFVVICIFAWRGGRPWIRLTFTLAVFTFALATAIITLRSLLTPAGLVSGISSADTVVNQYLCGRLTATILVPLYVIWYVNRAPARAFFRGTFAKSGPMAE